VDSVVPENTNSTNDQGVGEREKIQIQLSEYNTLRSEILTRTNHGFQIASIGIALAGLLLQKKEFDWPFWVALIILIVGIGTLLLFTIGIIGQAARQVQKLEASVNRRAGEILISWETVYGGAHGNERTKPFGLLVDFAEKIIRHFNKLH
jgi:hypothetical protein